MQQLKQLREDKLKTITQLELFKNALKFREDVGILSARKLCDELQKAGILSANVLHGLGFATRATVFYAIINRLCTMIDSVTAFFDVVVPLKAYEYQEIFDSVKRRFPEIIKTAYDFERIVQRSQEKQIKNLDSIFLLMKHCLLDIIVTEKDRKHFKNAVFCLKPQQCQTVFESFSESSDERWGALLKIIQEQLPKPAVTESPEITALQIETVILAPAQEQQKIEELTPAANTAITIGSFAYHKHPFFTPGSTEREDKLGAVVQSLPSVPT